MNIYPFVCIELQLSEPHSVASVDQHYGGGSHVSGPPSVASSIVDHQHHVHQACQSDDFFETILSFFAIRLDCLLQMSGPPSVAAAMDVPTGGGGGLMPSSSMATMDHHSNPPSVASTGIADHQIPGPSSVSASNVEHASGPPSVSSVDHMSAATQECDIHIQSVNLFIFSFDIFQCFSIFIQFGKID